MFGSAVLDPAIGLIFTFLAVSLAASAVTESISSLLKLRSKTLKRGIKDLLNDKSNGLRGLALEIYNHPLVNPRADGTATELKSPPSRKMPSYIDPRDFAQALMDVIGIADKFGPNSIMIEVEKIHDDQLRKFLTGIVDRAQGNLSAISESIAHWFDSAMTRVSGAYKRWSQLVSFLVAVLLVIALNISAIHVGERLWKQQIDTAKIGQIKAEDITNKDAAVTILKKLDQIEELAPAIGWQTPASFRKFWMEDLWSKEAAGSIALDAWSRIIGWLITAQATLFGAAFWFDMLQQFVRLKGSWPSPAERAQGKAAAA
jgi:hypothetical protein